MKSLTSKALINCLKFRVVIGKLTKSFTPSSIMILSGRKRGQQLKYYDAFCSTNS